MCLCDLYVACILYTYFGSPFLFLFLKVESRVRLVAYSPVVPAPANIQFPLVSGVPVNQAFGVQANAPIEHALGPVGVPAVNQVDYGVPADLVDPVHPMIMQFHEPEPLVEAGA